MPIKGRFRSAIVWLLSPKYLVGVSGLVLDEHGHVLLLHHTYRGRYPWGLPGGGLKPGESLEECLEREVFEETGLRVEAEHMLSAAAHYDRRLVDMIFSCRLADGRGLERFRPSAEVSEARFFGLEELPEGMLAGHGRLIERAVELQRET
jgi:ADP-ribose pyrophosphatase YjhB (NUDIX family)